MAFYHTRRYIYRLERRKTRSGWRGRGNKNRPNCQLCKYLASIWSERNQRQSEAERRTGRQSRGNIWWIVHMQTRRQQSSKLRHELRNLVCLQQMNQVWADLLSAFRQDSASFLSVQLQRCVWKSSSLFRHYGRRLRHRPVRSLPTQL